MSSKPALKYSYLYAIASVFIGPALVFFSSKHPSGWDCYDSSWYVDGAKTIPVAQRELIYQHDARFMAPVATIMTILGILLLCNVLYRAAKAKQLLQAIVPATLIVFMLLGYGMIIAVATSGWC